ncbi:hypothetical protein EDP1_4026 [Pseudomonas putida S610]|nr:hypothetical protein EDP1_4026 [Pseudomonas putida S610]
MACSLRKSVLLAAGWVNIAPTSPAAMAFFMSSGASPEAAYSIRNCPIFSCKVICESKWSINIFCCASGPSARVSTGPIAAQSINMAVSAGERVARLGGGVIPLTSWANFPDIAT